MHYCGQHRQCHSYIPVYIYIYINTLTDENRSICNALFVKLNIISKICVSLCVNGSGKQKWRTFWHTSNTISQYSSWFCLSSIFSHTSLLCTFVNIHPCWGNWQSWQHEKNTAMIDQFETICYKPISWIVFWYPI